MELSCETKPISRLRISGTAPGNGRPPSAELSDCGLGTAPRRDACPVACRLGPARADCAKQTQLARANYAKRTQSADPGPGGHRPGDLTGGAFSRADCAKQTQFAFERNEGQVLWGKGVMVNFTYKGPWKNKANFRRDSNGRGWARPTVPPVGLVVQTNPMCDRLSLERRMFVNTS